MALPEIVSHEEWLAARKKLLADEKEITRRIDVLNADRRRLPMVKVEKPYRFLGADGEIGLADMFTSRQLIVQHVMFHPEWENACDSCTSSVDELPDGTIAHLAERETTFVLVSRTPYEKIAAYRDRKGWTLPWYSSLGSDFNYDFDVTMDPAVKAPVYNYRPLPWDVEPGAPQEQPGISCFLRDGDDIFHTYSTYARGSDHLGGGYTFLDLTALGRQEEWEEPKGRVEFAKPAQPNFK
ncbi:MAG TPA: DUF899 domain-containing protein [Pseudonocardiaceae bacterium]|jgi:predicted dithiol-disulfide oxidoreductase (DUF899 family)